MRVLILFTLSMLLSSYSYAITLKEAYLKCQALSAESRVKAKLCIKVDEKIAQIKAAKAQKNSQAAEQPKSEVTPMPVAPKKVVSTQGLSKAEKIKAKCKQLGNEKMAKYAACRQYLTLEPDPIQGDSIKGSQYNLNLGYNLFGNVNGSEFELERRSTNFGFGLFFAQQTISDLDENEVTGSAYGLSLKYHLTNLSYVQKSNFDFAGFLQVGLTQYESDTQGKLPSYFYTNFGLEVSAPIGKIGSSSISAFTRLGIVHIYHSESDFLNLGSTGTVGLQLGF